MAEFIEKDAFPYVQRTRRGVQQGGAEQPEIWVLLQPVLLEVFALL